MGPLPSFFYFALSGPDSLCKDPYNQIVPFLQEQKIRVFSMTLPGHEANLSPENALNLWAEDIQKGINCIEIFLDGVLIAIDFAIRNQFIDPKRMGVGGLSRGGFIAAHAAARDERFRFLLCFAPLTRLSLCKEFQSMQQPPLVKGLDLEHLAPKLFRKHCRFYIGNHDTRVSVRSCFETVMAISEEAHKNQIRSPQVECIISPSIGRDGHGTSFETFKSGALWISEYLNK